MAMKKINKEILKVVGSILLLVFLLAGCFLDPQAFRVLFETDGGSTIEPAEGLKEGDLVPEPSAPVRPGYDFGGWYADQEYTESWDFSGDVVESQFNPGKLYAKWTAQGHTLSFNANGGSGSMNDIALDTDEDDNLPANTFTRAEYAFKGWSTSSTGDVVYSDEGSFSMGPSDTVLYAVWEPENYLVTYVLNGGTNSAANPATYTIVDSTVTLSPPSYEGHLFLGWYSDSNYTTPSTEIPSGSTGAKTFHALWRWVDLTTGDIGPAGGLIFYDDEEDGVDDLPGFRYLEAAPSGWYGTADDPDLLWGGVPKGKTEKTLGTGMNNTNHILAGVPTRNQAAHVCYAYTRTNDGVVYNDWFLPSIDELELMYIFFMLTGDRGFTTAQYMSSSEYDIHGVWVFNFHGYGPNVPELQEILPVTSAAKVRPVRAF